MRISKKAAVLAVTYITAGFLVLGGFILQADIRAGSFQRKIAVNYNHAFSELATAMEELDVTLKKAVRTSTPTMMSAVCAQAYANAMGAQAALASLPYGNIELEHTAAFIAKTGDYTYFLSKSSAGGTQCDDETRENLRVLSESASAVSQTLSSLYAQLLSGSVSVDELREAEAQISSQEDSLVDTGMAGSFQKMESEFPELPSLIYDGPFSEHIENAAPLYLEGMEDIDEAQAEKIARKFIGAESENFECQYLREGDEIPVYVVTHSNGSEVMTFEISKAGGQVLYFGTSRPAGEAVLSPEEGLNIASQFLDKQGFDSMESTYWEQEGGELTVNFSYSDNGVICYPDLIKVMVSLDTGRIRGFESLGYMMCHTDRDIPEAAISTEDARGIISDSLNVAGHNMAVIPTSGKYELYCHEFLCEDQDGSRCLVYIDAVTGAEAKILLLLESENGTLTI